MNNVEHRTSANTVLFSEDNVKHVFPNVKDKLIIDFINGLDAAYDLNKRSKASHSFLKRNIELVSGHNKLRQESINDHLIVGLDACHEYFLEMSTHLQQHSYAVIQLKKTLDYTQIKVSEIVDFVTDFKDLVDHKFQVIRSEIDELDTHRKAVSHMENVLSRWTADRFKDLSPMGQCFCALDNLKWGDFGSYLYSSDNYLEKKRLLETLENKIIKIQKDILHIDANTDLSRSEWLEAPESYKPFPNVLTDVMQYQGDDSYQNPERYPLIFTATQLAYLDDNVKDKYSNLTLRRLDINRVSSRLIDEMLRGI